MPKNNETNWRDEVTGISTPADVGLRSYPTLQFINGQAGFKGNWRENGVFFIADNENVANKWDKVEFVPRGGDSIPGAIAKDITCSVIRMRRAWFVRDGNGNNKRFPWGDFDNARLAGKPRGKCQIILAVDGLDTLVSLSLSGMQSAYALQNNGWGANARKFLYDPAARILNAGKRGTIERLPSLQFRITIGAETNNGKPIYSQVGIGDAANSVTRIVLKSPITTVESDADIARHIVSRVIRESYEIAYSEADEWVGAWNKAENNVAKLSEETGEEEIPF